MKKSHPSIKAVIMGTIRYDTYSFVPTDDGWPGYMHILPILD